MRTNRIATLSIALMLGLLATYSAYWYGGGNAMHAAFFGFAVMAGTFQMGLVITKDGAKRNISSDGARRIT